MLQQVIGGSLCHCHYLSVVNILEDIHDDICKKSGLLAFSNAHSTGDENQFFGIQGSVVLCLAGRDEEDHKYFSYDEAAKVMRTLCDRETFGTFTTEQLYDPYYSLPPIRTTYSVQLSQLNFEDK